MGQPITKRYSPVVLAAGVATPFSGNAIGGFLCTTVGTLTVTANAADGKPSYTVFTIVLPAVGWYELPFYIGAGGGIATITTGAGTLGVA